MQLGMDSVERACWFESVIPAVKYALYIQLSHVSVTLFNLIMGPFYVYVEWVEPRAVISAVKCTLYIKLSRRPGVSPRGPAYGIYFGYFPDISVWQQPCSRAAMYSGDWGKSLFTSLISYAGSYTQNCLLIISVQTHALKFANLV